MGVNTSSNDTMVDGTLFKSRYYNDRAQYRITSHTPIDNHPPLVLTHWVERIEATQDREANWAEGRSIDSSAMAIGIDALLKQIPEAVRKIRQGEIVQSELEELEGFGSF